MLHIQSPSSVSKFPVNQPKSRLPNGGPFGESCLFSESSLACLLNSSINILLIKRNFALLLKALGKECPPCSPKWGPYRNRYPFPDPYFGISFGVPSKGALPLGSLHRATTARDAPFPEPYFIHLSKSPIYEPSSRFPSGALWREITISRAFLYISFRVPTKGDLLQVPITGLP
jgi:hypothetical protein